MPGFRGTSLDPGRRRNVRTKQGPFCKPRVGRFPGQPRARDPCAFRLAPRLWQKCLPLPRRHRRPETGIRAVSATLTEDGAEGAGSAVCGEDRCPSAICGKRGCRCPGSLRVFRRSSDDGQFRCGSGRQQLGAADSHHDILLMHHREPIAIVERGFQRQYHVFLDHRVVECGE